jgi:hypothetical protein
MFGLNELKLLANKCRENGALCVIDEAYHPYSSVTAQSLVRGNENIVVTRSFSKSWGMAGVRVGYIIANKNTTDQLRLLFNEKGVLTNHPFDMMFTDYSNSICFGTLRANSSTNNFGDRVATSGLMNITTIILPSESDIMIAVIDGKPNVNQKFGKKWNALNSWVNPFKKFLESRKILLVYL